MDLVPLPLAELKDRVAQESPHNSLGDAEGQRDEHETDEGGEGLFKVQPGDLHEWSHHEQADKHQNRGCGNSRHKGKKRKLQPQRRMQLKRRKRKQDKMQPQPQRSMQLRQRRRGEQMKKGRRGGEQMKQR